MKYLVGASTDAPWYVVPAANADGVTDDTIQMQAALDTGFDVMLDPGKTYLINGTLKLTKAGQAVYLNGATVKRGAQISSTLPSGVTAGASQLTVADGSFAVGMTVSTTAAGGISALIVTAAGSGYTSAPSVAISGNATGTSSVDAGGAQRVVSATVTGAGSGYLTQPTITLSGGAGTGAALMAALNTTDESNSPPKIKQIVNGNVLLLDNALAVTQVAGATVYTCGFMFDMQGGDNAIIGPGTIDGNRANQTYFRWQSTACIRVFSDRCRVQQVHIINAAGEGIEVYNSDAVIEQCVIENLNGNGIHLTNSPNATMTPPGGHILIKNCRVYNCNLDASVGHANGGIIWSDDVLDGTVIGCEVDTSPLMGIGSIDSTTNSDVTLSDNVLVNCLNGGIGITPGQAASAPVRIVVQGNRLRNCGNCQNIPAIQITQTNASPTAFILDVCCQGNQIDTSGSIAPAFAITDARGVAIQGNVCRGPTNGANNSGGIVVKDSKHCVIQGNTITGYTYGVRFLGTTSEDVAISGNSITNVHTNGIVIPTGLLQGISVTGNVIDGDSTVTSAFTAISLGDACTCVGNSVYVAAGSASVGINVSGSNNTVIGNQIRGGSSQPKTGLNFAASTTENVGAANTITSNAVTQINVNGTTINDTTPGSGNYQTA